MENGSYILAPSHYISGDVPIENILAELGRILSRYLAENTVEGSETGKPGSIGYHDNGADKLDDRLQSQARR